MRRVSSALAFGALFLVTAGLSGQAVKERRVIECNDRLRAVAFSPTGNLLAVGSVDSTITLWDPATGKRLRGMGHVGYVECLAFSRDGKILVSGGKDKMVRVWDPATGKELHTCEGHQDTVDSVAVSPDGKTIASASAIDLKIWDANTAKELHSWLLMDFRLIKQVVFSPDGKTLVLALQEVMSASAEVRLWDLAQGKVIRDLQGRAGTVHGAVFSPDGKTIASAHQYGGAKTYGGAFLWSVATGKQVRVLKGHQGAVYKVAFSPDGKTLATASADDTVRLWDVSTGRERTVLRGHKDQVMSIAYSPDGKTLASASLDKTVRLWSVPAK